MNKLSCLTASVLARDSLCRVVVSRRVLSVFEDFVHEQRRLERPNMVLSLKPESINGPSRLELGAVVCLRGVLESLWQTARLGEWF